VPSLMKNLVDYINHPEDSFRPLVRTAIVHAQFETIHPFMAGNGRVGRMLIPMHLYYPKKLDLPCFFISEALERDKIRYYNLLNNIRYEGDWNGWIKFFLATVTKQCEKYIALVSKINALYEKRLNLAKDAAHSANIVDIMNQLYQRPITNATQIAEKSDLPITSVRRYLGLLVDKEILFTDGKGKNRTYFYSDLLEILR